MKRKDVTSTTAEAHLAAPAVEGVSDKWRHVVRRRSFLAGLGLAGAAVPSASLLATKSQAASDKLPSGDVAILKFLAAVELIETDLWQQYNELGGVKGGNPAYMAALSNLDGDMPQYISDNTDDEISHAAFLNHYLISKGEQMVDLKRFETLPGSRATGADQSKRRLTNLQQLHVDTSFYTRYRSAKNPDFGDTFEDLYKGTADLFLHITSNYKFTGYDILPDYGVFDIFKNPDIPCALEDYKRHLEKHCL